MAGQAARRTGTETRPARASSRCACEDRHARVGAGPIAEARTPFAAARSLRPARRARRRDARLHRALAPGTPWRLPGRIALRIEQAAIAATRRSAARIVALPAQVEFRWRELELARRRIEPACAQYRRQDNRHRLVKVHGTLEKLETQRGDCKARALGFAQRIVGRRRHRQARRMAHQLRAGRRWIRSRPVAPRPSRPSSRTIRTRMHASPAPGPARMHESGVAASTMPYTLGKVGA